MGERVEGMSGGGDPSRASTSDVRPAPVDAGGAAVAPRLGYRPQLDGLRAIAVTLVVIYHFSDWRLPRGGWVGVDLFFALSGFLITTLLFEEWDRIRRIRLGHFWMRRLIRLVPPLLLLLTVYSAAVLIFGDQAFTPFPAPTVPELIKTLLAAIFYVFNWFVRVDQRGSPGIAHLWTLAVEEQFYVFWPLVFVLAMRWGRRVGVVVAAVVLGVASFALMFGLSVAGVSWWKLYTSTPTRMSSLLVACAAAGLWALQQPRWLFQPGPARRAVWVAGILIVAAMAVGANDEAAFMYRGGFVLLSVGAAVCALATVQVGEGLIGQGLRHPLSVWIGRRSYAIYLWHEPIHIALTGRMGVAGVFAIGIPLTLLAAEVSFRLVERPFVALRARYRV